MIKDFIKVALAVLAVVLVRGFLGLDNFQAGIDDSNIYFVYVRNIFDGHGFVYNIGGPRVEGFTSFLWTIILTAVYALKFLPFEASLLFLCFLVTTITVYIHFRFIKSKFSETRAWLIVAYLLLIPGFIDWNVFTLMDLCLWILATSSAIILLLNKKHPRLFFIIIILLPLIRPEGIAVSLILFGIKVIRDHAGGIDFLHSIKRNLVLLVAIILSISILTVFRLQYFGYPVPNTFYAKVSMSVVDNIRMAFFYFYDALRHTSFVPFIMFLLCLVWLVKNRRLSRWKIHIDQMVLAFLILFFIGYPFLTGGDHFKYSRFYQPVFPLIGLLFMLCYGPAIDLKKTSVTISAFIVLILLNLNSTNDASLRDSFSSAARGYISELRPDLLSSSQLQSEFDIAMNGRNLADHMNKMMSSCSNKPSYGVIAAGGIGYIYQGQTIDLMGLNNPEMAHADKIKTKGVKNHGSFNKDVFYRQDVDIFLTWPDPLEKEQIQDDSSAVEFLEKLRDRDYFINRVCSDIFNDMKFKSLYKFSRISGSGIHVYGFIDPSEFRQKFPCLRAEPLENMGD